MRESRCVAGTLEPVLRIVAGLLGSALLACALPGRALTPQQIFEEAAPSIVRIDSVTRSGGSVGTGFAVSDRWIATNLHVIDRAARVVVQLQNGARFEVRRVIAIDESQDLAILETSARGLRPLPMADSDQLAEGQRIYAIGNPLGLDYTITDGLFSGRRTLEGEGIEMLQVSASLSPGSSGGPLLSEQGQVVGVATRTYATQPFGLGIPSNALRRLTSLSGTGQRFEDFAAERLTESVAASRSSGPPGFEQPTHPVELIESCPPAELRRLVVSIIQAIERGAPAYNNGSPEDCFRIYEGAALRLTRELQSCEGGRQALEDGLGRAGLRESYDDKAWAMRYTFNALLDVVERRFKMEAAAP